MQVPEQALRRFPNRPYAGSRTGPTQVPEQALTQVPEQALRRFPNKQALAGSQTGPSTYCLILIHDIRPTYAVCTCVQHFPMLCAHVSNTFLCCVHMCPTLSYAVCTCVQHFPMLCAHVSNTFLCCVYMYQTLSYAVCTCIS